jgi:flagellar assembly protein FliH
MPVIRSNNLAAAPRAFSMADVEELAKRMLLKAKLQAEQLINAALEEAEQLKAAARDEGSKEGFDHGHQEGLKHGIEAGKQEAIKQHSAELKTVIKSLTTGLTELDTHRRDLQSQALREVVELAISVARRVTRRQGEIDPGVLEANLADALKLAISAADVRVAVHPQQLAGLKAVLPALKLKWPNLKHVELLADDTLAVGGCRVYTRNGSIDADLNTQLDRIIADLLPKPAGLSDAGGGAPA